MSPRRRTLSFVVIFLSVNDGLVSSQVSPDKFPRLSEICPNFKGPSKSLPLLPPQNSLNIATPNDLLLAAQRLLPGSQRPILNEVVGQPLISEPSIIGGPQSFVNFNPLPNPPIPFTQIPCNMPAPAIPSAEVVSLESLALESNYPPPVEYFGYIDQNNIPLGPLPQSIPYTETVYTERFTPNPELAQFYQTNVNVQIPSMPGVSPFIGLATPIPGMLPQNNFAESYVDLVQEPYQGIVETNVVEAAAVVESPVIPVPVVAQAEIVPNVVESVAGYSPQLPLSFQINMPPSPSSEPIILISSPAPAPVLQESTFPPPLPPMVPPPSPMIIMERSRSKWSSLLPILLIALCDGGCQNYGGNCCSCSTNIPVPYPIPIPTNNPIITGRRRSKSKTQKKAKGN
ncbi:uncharacterized protein LOC142982229 [Anticarsia gemmatalis]|uniref:uncharacterized protein LOC142982229 n=1 Tax=Anticarsia gemmatalis TaxID=129554 RepID=UPI003F775BAF